MKFEVANEFAALELIRLKPYIVRGEIAGSIRRGKGNVKDAEIVIVPKPDMFGEPAPLPKDLYPKNSIIKNGDKYKQIIIFEGFNLDLFIVTPPADWGVIFTIRTGPPEFSHWIVTKREYGGALPSYARVDQGAVWQGDEKIPMPEEQDFLDFLGLGWVEPGERYPKMPVKI